MKKKRKPQSDPTIPIRLIRATAVIQNGGSYADFVKALNPQGKP